MDLKLECEQEDDGRWLAEVPELPGVLAYGSNAEEAMTKAEALAFRVLAERLEHGESRPLAVNFTLQPAV
jgi:predicted RNase H-like HicB family nuclease